jgi:hypothetical protein
VCTLHFPDENAIPPQWIVVVTWKGKAVRRDAYNRMVDALASANRARDRLRLRDWVAIEGAE